MARRFYMVLGQGMPTVRHPTYDSAQREAERLARIDRGKTFVVLASVSETVVSDVRTTVHEASAIDNDVPF